MNPSPPNDDAATGTQLEHSHSREAIAERVASNSSSNSNYLRDFVYGAIDGAVTTFAVVSGVAGAGLQPEIIVVLGFANLVGDGFSMAASNYLGTRTEQQLLAKARSMEQRHIQLAPAASGKKSAKYLRQRDFRERTWSGPWKSSQPTEIAGWIRCSSTNWG